MTVFPVKSLAWGALALVLPVAVAAQEVGRPLPLSQPFDPDTMERVDPPAGEPIGQIEVDALKAPNPQGIGTMNAAQGGFAATLWEGTPVSVARTLIPLLPAGSGSRALAGLERRLLLTTAPPPAGARPEDRPSLVELRAERLLAMGALDDLLTLSRAVPAAVSGPLFERVRRDGKLLSGDLQGACADAASRAPDLADPQQPKMLVLCQLTSGRGLEANFGLDLMRERKEPDHAFIAAAEVLAGVPAPEKVELEAATPLHVAAFTAAKLALPESSLAQASAAVAQAVAQAESNPVELRMAAAERAEAAGSLKVDALRKVYLQMTFAPDELSSPMTRADTAGPRARALLFRAATDQPDAGIRAQFVAKAVSLAQKQGQVAAAARVFEDILTTIRPDPSLAVQAPAFARALYALDRPEAAAKWLDMARGNDGAMKEAASLWPLSAVAEAVPGREVALAGLAGWRQSLTGLAPETAARRMAVVLGSLAGLGSKIPPELWLETLALPRSGPKPGLFALIQSAALDAKLGTTLLAVLAAVGDTPLSQLDSITLSDSISALSVVGQGESARRLAIEAMLANGV
jgi:hypothetical protein